MSFSTRKPVVQEHVLEETTVPIPLPAPLNLPDERTLLEKWRIRICTLMSSFLVIPMTYRISFSNRLT